MARIRRPLVRLSRPEREAVNARLRGYASAAKKDGIDLSHRWRRDDLIVAGTVPENAARPLTVSVGKSTMYTQLVHAVDQGAMIDSVATEILRELLDILSRSV